MLTTVAMALNKWHSQEAFTNCVRAQCTEAGLMLDRFSKDAKTGFSGITPVIISAIIPCQMILDIVKTKQYMQLKISRSEQESMTDLKNT